ncbi:MAG: helix-turn-helix domain-containing protein [Candidatus Nezhaarchaeales archaeon]|mgnify:CR=1 FL=1
MSEAEKIKEVLKQNPQGLSATKIAELAGLSRTKAAKILKELEASGEVIVEIKGCRKTYKPKS